MRPRRLCFHGRKTATIPAILALRLAVQANQKADSVVVEAQRRADEERRALEAHIEGLRKLVRSQQERIAELEQQSVVTTK